MSVSRSTVVYVLLFVLVAIYAGAHVESPGDHYLYESMDYENVVPVIHAVFQPEVFDKDPIYGPLTRFHLSISPIYYGLLAIPLSTVTHPVTALKFLGYLTAIGLFVLGAYPYNKYGHWLRGGMLGVYFLHIGHWGNPIFGTRKSLVPLLLVAGLIIDRHGHDLWRYLLVALAIGIYPMTGLVLIGFFLSSRFAECWEAGEARTLISNSLIYGGIAGIMLTPFLVLKLTASVGPSGSFSPIQYEWFSISGFVDTFLVGHGSHGRGALIRRMRGLYHLMIPASLCLLGWIVSTRRWCVEKRYGWLMLSGGFFWTLAHVCYPYLYQPTKYTKIIPAVLCLFLFTDHLDVVMSSVKKHVERIHGRIVGAVLFIGSSGAYLVFLRESASWLELTTQHPERIIGRLGLGLLIASGIVLLTVNWNQRVALTAGLLVLAGVIYIPHSPWLTMVQGVETRTPDFFKGAYPVLQESPEDSRFVATEQVSSVFPLYARRPPLFRKHESDPESINRKAERFYSLYCGGSPRRMARYMERNRVEFLVVGRAWFTRGWCQQYVGVSAENGTGMNRYFKQYRWKRGEYYLLSRQDLRLKSGD